MNEQPRIYFGSPGADLKDMTEVTGCVADGFQLLGEAAQESGEQIIDAFKTWSIGVEVNWTPELYRTLFGEKLPKRWRKDFVSAHRQVRKQARAAYRAAQRHAIGIVEGDTK